MSRQSSAAANSFRYDGMYEFNAEEKNKLLTILNGGESDLSINVIPQIFKMPTLSQDEQLQAYSKDNFIVMKPVLFYDSEVGLSYWSLESCNKALTACEKSIKVFVSSPKVPKSGLLSSLSSLGIIGLYTVVVLTLYSLVKSDYVGQAHTIMFKNLPNNLGLLQLCDDIIIARQDGDLRLEEDLVKLIIYRYLKLKIEK